MAKAEAQKRLAMQKLMMSARRMALPLFCSKAAVMNLSIVPQQQPSSNSTGNA